MIECIIIEVPSCEPYKGEATDVKCMKMFQNIHNPVDGEKLFFRSKNGIQTNKPMPRILNAYKVFINLEQMVFNGKNRMVMSYTGNGT